MLKYFWNGFKKKSKNRFNMGDKVDPTTALQNYPPDVYWRGWP